VNRRIKILVLFLLPIASIAQIKGFNIGLHLPGEIPSNSTAIESRIRDMKELGSDWVRIDVTLESILNYEKNKNYKALDSYIHALVKENISVIVQVRGFNRGNHYLLKNGKTEGIDLQKFIRRYPPVKYWQLENEIMSNKFWEGSLDDYAGLLKEFYHIVKSSGNDKFVIFAGISSNFLESSIGLNKKIEYDFSLEDYFKKNAGYYDIVDLHLYHNPATIPEKISLVRKFSSKPIISTEIGGPDIRSRDVNKMKDKDYYSEVYNRIYNCYKNGLSLVLWHSLNSNNRDYKKPGHHMALKNMNKPNIKYYILKEIISKKEILFPTD